MSLTEREVWTVLHGMAWGGLFLLSFAGGMTGLWLLRYRWVDRAGVRVLARRLTAGIWIMALAAWLTVLTGTYIVFPWYRANPPEGTADLTGYPRAYLEADPDLATWHTFGAVWKEHVSWMAPILATAVAYVVYSYGTQLAAEPRLRRALIVLFSVAFLAATVGGVFGALLNKVAPVQ